MDNNKLVFLKNRINDRLDDMKSDMSPIRYKLYRKMIESKSSVEELLSIENFDIQFELIEYIRELKSSVEFNSVESEQIGLNTEQVSNKQDNTDDTQESTEANKSTTDSFDSVKYFDNALKDKSVDFLLDILTELDDPVLATNIHFVIKSRIDAMPPEEKYRYELMESNKQEAIRKRFIKETEVDDESWSAETEEDEEDSEYLAQELLAYSNKQSDDWDDEDEDDEPTEEELAELNGLSTDSDDEDDDDWDLDESDEEAEEEYIDPSELTNEQAEKIAELRQMKVDFSEEDDGLDFGLDEEPRGSVTFTDEHEEKQETKKEVEFTDEDDWDSDDEEEDDEEALLREYAEQSGSSSDSDDDWDDDSDFDEYEVFEEELQSASTQTTEAETDDWDDEDESDEEDEEYYGELPSEQATSNITFDEDDWGDEENDDDEITEEELSMNGLLSSESTPSTEEKDEWDDDDEDDWGDEFIDVSGAETESLEVIDLRANADLDKHIDSMKRKVTEDKLFMNGTKRGEQTQHMFNIINGVLGASKKSIENTAERVNKSTWLD